MRRLLVLMHGAVAGFLDSTDGQTAAFSYVEGYASNPVSVSMPPVIGARSYDASSWIDGLLADNDKVRRRWSHQHGAVSEQPFDLLATEIGYDCPGAVQFCQPEQLDRLLSRGGARTPVTDMDVADMVARLRLDSSAWHSTDEETTSAVFSLAGAQGKTALCYNEATGQWSVPHSETPTTHILKPPPNHWPDLDVVEHLCMEAASRLELAAARTSCVEIGAERALLVTRYDRWHEDDHVDRIHQEDMCQALAIHPGFKYQNEGGPTPEQIADLIRSVSTEPQQDVAAFRDALIYNWLIVGTDAHAKNYSLLLDGYEVRLAPLYDVASFLPYRESIPVGKLPLAMRIGRDYTVRKADRRSAWERTADALGLDPEETVDRAADMARRLPDAMDASIGQLPPHMKSLPVVARLSAEVSARGRQCSQISHRAAVFTAAGLGRGRQAICPAALQPATRCTHIGPQSRRQCILPASHTQPHRYQW